MSMNRARLACVRNWYMKLIYFHSIKADLVFIQPISHSFCCDQMFGLARHSIAWKYLFIRFGISKVEMDPPLVTSIHLFCNFYVSPFLVKIHLFSSFFTPYRWNGHCDFESLKFVYYYYYRFHFNGFGWNIK